MQISPFRALRYDDPTAGIEDALGVIDLSPVIGDGRAARSGYSVDRLLDEPRLVHDWLAEGTVSFDATDNLYIYRSGAVIDGLFVQRSGVIGVIGAPTSPVDTFVPVVRTDGEALDHLLDGFTGHPIARATDADGVHHRLWATASPSFLATLNRLLEPVDDPGGESSLRAITTGDTTPPMGLVMHAEGSIVGPLHTGGGQ